jgi:hypothetical protein
MPRLEPGVEHTETVSPGPAYSADKDNIQSLNGPVPKMIEGYGKANDCSPRDAILAFK